MNFLRYAKVVNISNRFNVLVCVICTLFIIYFIIIYSATFGKFLRRTDVNHDESIPDILEDSDGLPPKGRSIFFIETSKKLGEDWIASLSIRQACSVESAALLNPDKTIYVIFTLPLLYPNIDQCVKSKCTIIRNLLKYRNVKMRSVNMVKYFEGTPLEEWLEKGELWKSKNLIEHTSDVMRLLTLWKFGGTYLDLDVVVLKSFEDLNPNFAGIEIENVINNAVINFDHANFGHNVIERCLREIQYNFRGDLWSHNGPGVITRVLSAVCNTSKTRDMTPAACNGFQVFPEQYFYPINYSIWPWLFAPDKVDDIFERIKDAHALHLWNKLSHDQKIPHPNETSVAYTRIAEMKCPNTFQEM